MGEVDFIPLIGAIFAFAFASMFSTVRWERSAEGRDLMATSASLVVAGLGDAFDLDALEWIGWGLLAACMVHRFWLLNKAQRIASRGGRHGDKPNQPN